MTADGAHHPDGLPVEAAVDGDPVSIVPVPRGRTGHPDWVALAAALPAPPLTGSRLPMPDGWVRIPLAGFDQVLYWAEGAHYEGIMPQVTLRRLPAGDPAVALLGHDDGAGLALGIEPWVAGPWRGIHGAWSRSRYGSRVIRRRWILDDGDDGDDGGEHGLLEVESLHPAYLSRYLTPVLNGMVAGITPEPAGSTRTGDLSADLDGAVDAAADARARLADAGAGAPGAGLDGRLTPTSLDRAARDRAVVELGGGPGWQVTAGGQRSGAAAVGHLCRLWTAEGECLVERAADGGLGLTRVGRHHRDDAADLVLRMVGHRPEGPSDVPVDLWPAEAFAARLADPAEPLPAALPEGAHVSGHMDPQTIYRWWTAPWTWWSLHRAVSGTPDTPGTPVEVRQGIRVLTVPGFGHYLWDAGGEDAAAGRLGSTVRLQAVDGLALFGVLAELLGPGS